MGHAHRHHQKLRHRHAHVPDAGWQVRLTNHLWNSGGTFDTEGDALAHATGTGFECAILRDGRPVGSYSPINGYRRLTGRR